MDIKSQNHGRSSCYPFRLGGEAAAPEQGEFQCIGGFSECTAEKADHDQDLNDERSLRSSINTAMMDGRIEGVQEGERRGMMKGKREGRREVAIRLKEKGLSLPEISDLTDLPPEEIERL